ncbi:MAG: cobyric acid synthase, partial [Hyphomicrobiales bacterium]|nr:cobyric acid synthase [Hyphomicrobiales bacterium]
SDVGSQVVVRGRVRGQARAAEYQAMKRGLLPEALDSFARLAAEADLVIVEGAGSAAETNLRANDIANLGFAEAADLPAIIVGDIDRGGVIAQLVGTKAVISAGDSARITGFVVNKFRGDPDLFAPAMADIAARTGWRALGLVPHFAGAARLPAEDALALERARPRDACARVRIVAPRLPHLANFDEFDALARETDVSFEFVPPGRPLPVCDLVVLPGSKTTIADLAAFRREGWDVDLAAHLRRGGRALGICGGYQMMGRGIADPLGMEGPPADVEGLGLLDVETVLTSEKSLREVAGADAIEGARFRGYEMHAGETSGVGLARPMLRFDDGRQDGAVSRDGAVRGCYVHGLFGDDEERAALLRWIGAESSGFDHEAEVEAALDGLAAHLAAHLDLDAIYSIARSPRGLDGRPAT